MSQRNTTSWLGFWLAWTGANGLAELVGLTSTLAMAAGAFSINDRVSLAAGLAIAIGVAALGASVEGVAVGGLQWLVLRRRLPGLPIRAWVIATAAGAFVAWVLGMLPSTLMSAAQAAASEPAANPFEPSLALQMAMGAGMGLVLGPFLGVPQWMVLRSYLPRAAWWIAANSLAWMLGMPMVFLGTSLIQAGDPAVVIGAYVALGCLAAGLVVGAVHGAWLVLLLRAAGQAGQSES